MRTERELLRNLLAAVRCQRLKSPEYREELKRRKKWRRWQLVGIIALSPLLLFAIVCLSVGVIIAGPVLFGPVHAYLFATLNHDPASVGPHGTTNAVILGAPALSLGALVCFVCAMQASAVWSRAAIFCAAFFPISDLDARRRNPLRWWVAQLYLAYALSFAAVSTAVLVHATPAQIVALCLSIPLNVCHVSALAMAVFSRSRCSQDPQPLWMLPALAFALAAIAVAYIGFRPPDEQDWIGWLLMLLPTGWANGAVYYLVFAPTLWGALFLFPLIATWIYAVHWLRRGISLREVFLSSASDWTPVFGLGLRNPRAIEALYDPLQATTTALNLAATSAKNRATILSALEDSATKLFSNSWGNRGWVERLAGRILTPREQAIAEQVIGRPLRWSAAWWWSAAFVVAFAAVLAIFLASLKLQHVQLAFNRGDVELTFGALAILWVIPALAFGEFMADLRELSAKRRAGFSRYHPVYPIGWSEFRRTLRKLVWLRLGLALPFFVPALLLDLTKGWGLLLLDCLGIVSLLLSFGILLETLACSGAMEGRQVSTDWWSLVWAVTRMLPTAFLTAIGLGGAYLTSIAFILSVPVLVVPGWLLMFMSGYGIRECWRWRYHHTELDFACGETIAPDPRRRR